MRFGAFAIVVCSIGCATIESEFDDPGRPVTVVENGFEREVVGPNYSMVFNGGGVLDVHMPASLQILGNETLATGARQDRLERLIGFGFFPALIATFDTAGTVIASDITTNDDGPFVPQISTSFTIEYTCGAPVNTRQFKATSIFTFFPNGRINRFDTEVQAVADGESLTGTAGVGCTGTTQVFNPNDQIILTSFWAFLASGNTVIVGPDGDDVAPPNTRGEFPGACTFYDSHSIGVRYKAGTTRVAPNGNADAHVRDFLDMTASSIDDTKFDTISQAQLRDAGDLSCSEILAQLDEPAIRVGDEEIPTQDQHGIYVDPFNPRDDAYDIEVIGNTAVPAGWVLATEPSSDTIRITLEDGSEPDYNVQRLEVGTNRMLIIFNEPLEPGQKITIEPL